MCELCIPSYLLECSDIYRRIRDGTLVRMSAVEAFYFDLDKLFEDIFEYIQDVSDTKTDIFGGRGKIFHAVVDRFSFEENLRRIKERTLLREMNCNRLTLTFFEKSSTKKERN
jgi:hypothetical protein